MLKNKILKVILILENLLISIILFYFITKNFQNFKSDFLYYLYIFDSFISKNLLSFSLSFVFLIGVLMSQIFLWKKIFDINFIKVNHLNSLYFFSLIHFKRLFSPLGPISPILNINEDFKKSTIIYTTYVIFITLGSIIFFAIPILLLYPLLIFIFPVIFILSKIIIKKIIGRLNLKDFFVLLFTSYLNEFFSYTVFIFSLKLFSININIFDSIFIYLIWVIISSLFPFLYGTGTSELLSIFLASYLGYNSALFALGIIYYRLIITYLPILLIILFKLKIFKN
ncbi:MAG: hypothetical protein KatS3mg095_0824 [Candidatus Parcubacteria bacterium]|nr:MAG: hypothetical protein KatS3mg095_0824 [Candidatus Parcubacteria bacterium]